MRIVAEKTVSQKPRTHVHKTISKTQRNTSDSIQSSAISEYWSVGALPSLSDVTKSETKHMSHTAGAHPNIIACVAHFEVLCRLLISNQCIIVLNLNKLSIYSII